jgi:hypothetical protein
MTVQDVHEIRHKGQLRDQQNRTDYVMLLGAALAGYSHLPLTVKNCLMLGSAALQCLPETAEESITGLMIPLADTHIGRLQNFVKE